MGANFENEFNKLELGMPIEEFSAKTLKTETSNLVVAQAIFEKQNSNISDYDSVSTTEKTNCYIVKNKSRYSNFQIKNTKRFETLVLDHGFAENTVSKSEVILNGRSIELKKGTDIKDINSVRYQIRNDKKIAAFIDNFILSDEQSRKKYAIYEKKQQYFETKSKQSALKRKNNSYS